ncbi:FadR/GntR family transcriptional regulator [Peribacillus sp. SCS-37]|uniref:FadR/GntR family transcriptional regulator n=1 Tax=Paraperibacillus esterisolvens TaxID=3115296 RepID=UPI0039059DFA
MNEKTIKAAAAGQSKIYLEVVEKLRQMIKEDQLRPGDKIPSERELSERLQVGRSSVREALRSLELLGLIETRRGEGTYIKVFQEHRLVELLGAFLLADEETKKNLIETRVFLEQSILHALLHKASRENIDEMILWAGKNDWDDEAFFKRLFQLNTNHLLERIWIIVNMYAKSTGEDRQQAPRQAYLDMLDALREKNGHEVNKIHLKAVRNMPNFL